MRDDHGGMTTETVGIMLTLWSLMAGATAALTLAAASRFPTHQWSSAGGWVMVAFSVAGLLGALTCSGIVARGRISYKRQLRSAPAE